MEEFFSYYNSPRFYYILKSANLLRLLYEQQTYLQSLHSKIALFSQNFKFTSKAPRYNKHNLS